MADFVLGLGQMLAMLIIVCGVTIALWQVWVLARKLRSLPKSGQVVVPTMEARVSMVDRKEQQQPTARHR